MSFASQATRSRSQFLDSDLDLTALGSTLWSRKWKILRPALLVGLATFLVVQVITPRYQSESRVIVETRDNIYLRPEADKQLTDPAVDEQAVASQAQLILSRDLATQVIQKLKLNQRAEFDPALGGISPVRAILGLIGIGKNPMGMTPEERVLEAYYDRLTVFPVDKSRVIVIDFLSEDPELAARVANAIADGYLELQRKVKQEQAQNAGEVLSGQIDTLRKKVLDAESKVETYRAKSNLLVGTNNTTLSAQQLGDMNAQLVAARAQKADAEAKAKLIRDMLKSGQPVESSDILNSELIRRLSEQRVTLRAQLAEQSSSLLDGHPRIKELKAQIADLDHQINEAAGTIARSLENDSKLASVRLDAMTANLDQLKTQAAASNADDVQLRELERDAKSQRDLLESLLAKYREATSRDTINSSPADARVISRATVSNVPAYPKKLPAILIATLTTLIISAGFVLTTELLAAPVGISSAAMPPARQRPLPSEPAMEPAATSRIAAALGKFRRKSSAKASAPPQPLDDDQDEEILRAPDSPIRAIDDVVHEMLRDGAGGPPVALFGAAQRMDASWSALKFARALGEDSRVILVGLGSADAALRAVSNDPSAGGLAELAAGTASFRDVITKDKQSGVHLITSGHEPTDRAVNLASAKVAGSFDALSRAYDHVVVVAGSTMGAEIETIGAVAPQAVLLTGTLTSSGVAAASQRLLGAGFREVVAVTDGSAVEPGSTAAAA